VNNKAIVAMTTPHQNAKNECIAVVARFTTQDFLSFVNEIAPTPAI
jgi:hypothetical protein